MRRHLSRRPGQRGAAAVEFAIIAPILVYLVFAIVSTGYMLSFRQAISQAAAEGARAAAVAPGGLTASQKGDRARLAVNSALDSYGITCSGSELKRSGSTVGACVIGVAACSAAPTTNCATVTIDYLYASNPLVPVPGLGIVLPDRLSYTAAAEVN